MKIKTIKKYYYTPIRLQLNWNYKNQPYQDLVKMQRNWNFHILMRINAEYIMRNAGLDEAQAGVKIAGRNINNLRYADNTTFMAESEEQLKSLLMKWKRRVKSLLKVQHSRNEDMASGSVTSWQIDGKQWKQWQTLLFGAPQSLQMVTAAMKLKDACPVEANYDQPI